MKRFFLLFCVLIAASLFFPSSLLASEYFSTSYYVTYTVSETAETHARIQVTLTNKSGQYYASSYKILVGFEHLANVQASDPLGKLETRVTKVDGGNTIEATFNKKAVGQGTSLTYGISFDTPDVAKKDGSIWEINIPGLENKDEVESFTAEVKVPESFGEPAYIKPRQPNNTTIFTKEQLGKSGISITYGKRQVYAFNLFYHLRNNNVFPVRTEIALPPSTNYQDVAVEYMNPKPTNVTRDDDGNWLASYRLLPSQRLTIQARGTARVSLGPKQEALSPALLAKYLEEKPYWESERTEMRELAKTLKTPKAIYEYLVDNLRYDFSRVENNKPRLGALGTLKEKSSAVCLEFTDLFIALARAAGIPAREVDGYANTENSRQRPLSLVKDILHAWPEYYDQQKQTWIMVDPTWGNTTGGVDYFDVLDFDHVAFVKRGVDSEYPIPAGGYKYKDDEDLKDVNISFPSTFTPSAQSIGVTVDAKEPYVSLLPIETQLLVYNTGQEAVSPQKISVQADSLTPASQEQTIPLIPPFGYASVPLKYDPPPLLTKKEISLTITIAGLRLTQTIRVVPLIFSLYAALGGICIGIFTTVILIVAKKTRRVPVS